MYVVRCALPHHIGSVPEIERCAAQLFSTSDLPEPRRSESTPTHTLWAAQRAGLLWVAVDEGDTPLGFLLAGVVGNAIHILEMDVHPRHGRKGIGSSLVRTLIAVAGQKGYDTVTLTTFRDVPWNAPFYAGLGFETIATENVSREIARILDSETDAGLVGRVAMAARITA